MKIVVVGAGMVGRGLIGELFGSSGWQVHFLDVNLPLIQRLDRDEGYQHLTIDTGMKESTWIGSVSASPVADTDAAVAHIAQADLVATAVGVGVLPTVAPLLSGAVTRRGRALDVLLCENLHDADTYMRSLINDEPCSIGLVRTSIGRMIPNPPPGAAATETTVAAEPYGFLPVDPVAFTSDVALPSRVIRDPSVSFSYYADRKLFVHNMGHFLTALLGQAAGDRYIWQAIERPEVRSIVYPAMIEAASAVAQRHAQRLGPLLLHVEDLLYRFSNRELSDTVERVLRDPARKLAPGDRMLGAIALCDSEGVLGDHIGLGSAMGSAVLAGTPWTFDRVMEETRLFRIAFAGGHVL